MYVIFYTHDITRCNSSKKTRINRSEHLNCNFFVQSIKIYPRKKETTPKYYRNYVHVLEILLRKNNYYFK